MSSKISARVTLGEQGRFVVPAEIRRALDVKPGDQLVLRAEDERLVIEKLESIEKRLLARFENIPAGVSLVDELIAERREAAKRDLEEIYPTAKERSAHLRVAEDRGPQ